MFKRIKIFLKFALFVSFILTAIIYATGCDEITESITVIVTNQSGYDTSVIIGAAGSGNTQKRDIKNGQEVTVEFRGPGHQDISIIATYGGKEYYWVSKGIPVYHGLVTVQVYLTKDGIIGL